MWDRNDVAGIGNRRRRRRCDCVCVFECLEELLEDAFDDNDRCCCCRRRNRRNDWNWNDDEVF
jgi:hypothetical protein